MASSHCLGVLPVSAHEVPGEAARAHVRAAGAVVDGERLGEMLERPRSVEEERGVGGGVRARGAGTYDGAFFVSVALCFAAALMLLGAPVRPRAPLEPVAAGAG